MKSFTQIVESMVSFFARRRPSLPTGEGSPIRDIVIDAPSREIAQYYSSLSQAVDDVSLQSASIAGLTALGQNVGVLRKAPVRALGTITFFSRNPISSDVYIPAGTAVSSTAVSGGTAAQFVTLQSVTMYADSSAIYLNTSTGLYEISVPVQAVVAGTLGNVGDNTVTVLASSVSGVDGCYNSAEISGGLDAESVELFRLRIAAAVSSSGVGTEDGYLTLVRSIAGVVDAAFVGHGETGRDAWGAIDIYIKGSIPRSYTDVVSSLGSSIPNIIFTKQPVSSSDNITVRSSSSGSVVSTQWSLSQDTGNYAGSIYAQDTLQWTSGSLPISYGTITLGYTYNGLVEDVQSLFVQTQYDVQNTNVLVKAAIPIAIDITASVKVLPGFTFTTVIALAEEEIITLFSSLAIGEELQQADVLRAILNVPGVDDVRVPFTVFRSSDGTITVNANNNLTIPANGTVEVGTLNLVQMF